MLCRRAMRTRALCGMQSEPASNSILPVKGTAQACLALVGSVCRCISPTRGWGSPSVILGNKIAPLDQLGLPPDVVESLRQKVTKTQGIGLIVGPTGSGKTTTLAALLDWCEQITTNISSRSKTRSSIATKTTLKTAGARLPHW